MMGRQSGQMSMLILDIEELIPGNHLLRQINQLVSFDFIYDLAAPYYPANGRPSVDPVSMFKMLLVGYLYGIKSERRLVQEVQLNIAYRWFCGFELGEKIPDHSTFSKTRVRKWNESGFFQKAFLEIVRRCIEQKLIDGKEMASDGSYIPAEVSRNSWIDVEVEVEQSILLGLAIHKEVLLGLNHSVSRLQQPQFDFLALPMSVQCAPKNQLHNTAVSTISCTHITGEMRQAEGPYRSLPVWIGMPDFTHPWH